MKLVWCPDMASKAYIDGVRAIAAADYSDGGSAELIAAMAGGWNAQLIVDAPADSATLPPPPSTPSPSPRPPATSLALAAAALRTGGRYARLDAHSDESAAAKAMARLEGVDLLVLDARRRDAAAGLRAARPGPSGMVVVVRHADTTVSASGSAAPPWGRMAAGTRLVRAAYLPVGAGGLEVLHVGVGEGPSLPTTAQQHQQGHSSGSRRRHGRGGRWIRHVNHRTGEEHVFRCQ